MTEYTPTRREWREAPNGSIDMVLVEDRADPPERFDRSWWHYADDCPVPPANPNRAKKLEILLLAVEEVDNCWRVDDSLFVYDDRLEPRLTALRHALEEYDNE